MKKIVFVCVHNSCRSQMAEALARFRANELNLNDVEFYSAGSCKTRQINPKAIKILKEYYDLDLKNHYVKTLDELGIDEYYAVVSMGCNMDCPNVKAKLHLDFNLADPSDFDDEEFKNSVEILDKKILNFLNSIKNSTLK